MPSAPQTAAEPVISSAKRLSGRIALVTGASRGIGRAVARELARQGAHVLALARSVKGLETLDDEIRQEDGTASLIPLDLTDAEKVDALGPALYQRFKRLDILIANAGVLGPLSPLTHIAAKQWQAVFDLNVHANWRLIRSLDPLLKLSDAGRAVFLTASAGSNPAAYWGPYAVSKAALEALVQVYAKETEKTAVRVNLVDPGPVRTSLRQEAFPGEVPHTVPAPEEIAPQFLELVLPECTAHGEVIRLSKARENPKL